MNRPSKSARYHPQWLYCLALVLFFASAGLAVEESIAPNVLFQFLDGLRLPTRIKWRTNTEALAECKRTRKTILYVMLPKGNPLSVRLEGVWLQESDMANFVNENFIPVRFSYGLWHPGYVRSRYADQQCGAEFKAFRLHLPNSINPALALVPYDDLGQTTLNYSTSSLSEKGVEGACSVGRGFGLSVANNPVYPGQLRYLSTPPLLASCESEAALRQFLDGGRIWHKRPSSCGDIRWLSPRILDQPIGVKPRLIFFLERNDRRSDWLRFDVFFDRNCSSLVNANFEPVLLEYDFGGSPQNKTIERLANTYNIQRDDSPVIVLDRGRGQIEAKYGCGEMPGLGTFQSLLEHWVERPPVKR